MAKSKAKALKARAAEAKPRREAPAKVKAAVLALIKEIGPAAAAKRCKVTASTLVALAHGMAAPQHPTLVRICKALKLPAPEAPEPATKTAKPESGMKASAKREGKKKLFRKPTRKAASKRKAPAAAPVVAETNSIDASAPITASPIEDASPPAGE